MVAILTADIINSRAVADQDIWLKPVKGYLAQLGPSPKTWEIYRGDSLQVEIADPSEVLRVAMHLKAIIRMNKELDIRMAIGIGEKSYRADKLTESNGSAFARSGEAFEGLKKSTTLTISSAWDAFNEEMNLYLKLANVIMSGWKPATAEIVKAYLNHASLSQNELGKLLGMKQPSVSDALSRASYYELMELDAYYRKRLKQQITGE